MAYDIATFKNAFGYKSGVVGKLAEVLTDRLQKDSGNQELRKLQEAVELQHEVLEKSAELERLQQEKLSMVTQMRMGGLQKQIKTLKENTTLELAAPQLKMLQDLYEAEQAKSSSTNPMMTQVVESRIKKAKQLLNLPESFTTRSEEEEVPKTKPKLEDVMRGGGELEINKVYKSAEGKSYKVEKAIPGGGHSAFKMVDQESGKEFLWKPASNTMMLNAEVGASKLSDRLMPGLVPPCDVVTVDGVKGTCQPFVKDADDKVKVDQLTETQQDQMVAHMLTDWLISNHDNHLGQFLFDENKNLIGIDKGQAFKHFKHGDVESQFVKNAQEELKKVGPTSGLGERHLKNIEPEHLDPNYFPSSNVGMPASVDFMKFMQKSMRQPDLKTGVIGQAVTNAKKLTLKDITELFGEYAKEAFPDQQEAFLKAVLERAQNMDKELANLPLSAPALAEHHTKAVKEVLDEKGDYRPGCYPQLVKELGALRTAIQTLKGVEGIDAAKPPKSPQETPDPKYVLQQNLKKLEEDFARLQKIDDDCKECEKYLSSSYKIVSPLLAAFEVQNVDPNLIGSPDYDYKPIQTKLLEDWKRIAVERELASPDLTEKWDEMNLATTYEIMRSMKRTWQAFPEPKIPNNQVTRGDISEHLFKNYSSLDPAKNNLEDGEHSVTISLTWPGVMSTTIGDPKQHNFIQKKTFIWSFNVASPCPGRVIGDINPAEQEVTFPAGVKVTIEKLIVRTTDKSLRSGEFGPNAIVIALAKLG